MFLVTCEHAGNEVPERWRHLFMGEEKLLTSHRGYDPGALGLAETVSNHLGVSLFNCMTTRLLIEANRTPPHPKLFSEFSRQLPASEREELLEQFWKPYRDGVVSEVEHGVRRGERVIHLSVHSFSPHWRGRERTVDVGVLDNPRDKIGRELSNAWLADLRRRLPEIRISRNRPYRGTTDSRITELRSLHDPEIYTGLELEVNQGLLLSPAGPALSRVIAESWRELVLRVF